VEDGIPSQLHVVTLTPFYPSDGDEVSGCFVAETLHQLERQNVTTSVLAVDSIYHAVKKSSRQYPAEWVRYLQLPGNFGLAGAGNFLGALLLSRVRKLHRRFPVSLIHAHAALPCGHAAYFLSHRLAIPYVVTIHGLDVYNRCFQSGMAARWRRKNSLRVYGGASRIICISKKVQELLAEGGCTAHSEVVYNGTNPELFAPQTQPTSAADFPPSLLIVGNLLAGKGHELVLRAVASLQDFYPALRCVIIGEGADGNRFVALARNLGISERVEFRGRKSRSEVAAAMRICTVFVLPSRYEGLGCVYLEAMASGKPVIGCRGQGIDEIIHHGSNGWLIPVDGLNELVQGLQILLANPDLRKQIGEAARRTISENVTLEYQARRLARIYEEVAK
jgi:glycosyltransferase involved in cell wall biosynthesis